MEDKGKLRKALKRRDKSKEKSATKWAAISKVCAQLNSFVNKFKGPGHTPNHMHVHPFPCASAVLPASRQPVGPSSTATARHPRPTVRHPQRTPKAPLPLFTSILTARPLGLLATLL